MTLSQILRIKVFGNEFLLTHQRVDKETTTTRKRFDQRVRDELVDMRDRISSILAKMDTDEGAPVPISSAPLPTPTPSFVKGPEEVSGKKSSVRSLSANDMAELLNGQMLSTLSTAPDSKSVSVSEEKPLEKLKPLSPASHLPLQSSPLPTAQTSQAQQLPANSSGSASMQASNMLPQMYAHGFPPATAAAFHHPHHAGYAGYYSYPQFAGGQFYGMPSPANSGTGAASEQPPSQPGH